MEGQNSGWESCNIHSTTLCLALRVVSFLESLVQAERSLAGWAGHGGGHEAQEALQSMLVGTAMLLMDLLGLGLLEGKSKPCHPDWWIQRKAVALASVSRWGNDLAMSCCRENLPAVPGRIWLLGKLRLKKHEQTQTWANPGGSRPSARGPSSLETSRSSLDLTWIWNARWKGKNYSFHIHAPFTFLFPLIIWGIFSKSSSPNGAQGSHSIWGVPLVARP